MLTSSKKIPSSSQLTKSQRLALRQQQAPKMLTIMMEVPPSINENTRAHRGSLRDESKPVVHVSSKVTSYKNRTIKALIPQVQVAKWPVYEEDWYAVLWPVPMHTLRTDDLDNRIKIGFDCLVEARAMWDDSRVVSILPTKVPALREGVPMKATIYRLSLPPVNQKVALRQRLTQLAESSALMYQRILEDAGVFLP